MIKNNKNIFKLLGLIFTFVLFAASFSSVSAVPLVTSTPQLYGYDSKCVPTKKGSSESTGKVVYYPATIGGKKAFCMGYCMALPSNVSNISSTKPLTTTEMAVLYEGKTGEKGGKKYSDQVIQLALWMATTQKGKNLALNSTTCNIVSAYKDANDNEPYYGTEVVINGKTQKIKAMKKSTLANAYNMARQLYSQAKSYSDGYFKSSSQLSINVDGSASKQQIKNGYVYVGPVKVKSNSKKAITIELNTETTPITAPIQFVSSINSDSSLSSLPAGGGTVYLKVPIGYSGRKADVIFNINNEGETIVNGYRYSSGNSSDQDFAVITIEDGPPISKPWPFEWDLEGKITINKYVTGSTNAIEGAKFQLYKCPDTKNTNNCTKVGSPQTTDKNGKIIFKKLDLGIYRVKETSVPDGYKINKKFSDVINLNTNLKSELTVYNDIDTKKGKITIVKKSDFDLKPLSGVAFSLFKSKKGDPIATKTTDKNGTIIFDDLDYDTYYIKEMSTPTGYIILNSDFITINLDEKNDDVKKEIKNHLVRGRVQIKKIVEMAGKETSPAAGDVTFSIYSSNGVQVDQMKVNDRGVATSNYLPLGDYYLKETAVNSSYIKINPTKKISFSITKENDNKIISLEDFVNEGITGQLELYKYAMVNGKKTAIPNAKFKIYKLKTASGGTAANNLEYINTVKTNVKGMAYLYDLEDGTYAYQEEYVPEGYELDSTIRLFNGTISKTNKKLSAEFENKIQIGSIKIIKTVQSTGKRLGGVEITVYNSDKKTIAKDINGNKCVGTTNSNGELEFKNLKYGTYYVKETNAPDNVIMDTNFHRATVSKGQNPKEVNNIKNELIDLGIKLKKVDDENKPIQGVKFAIYSDKDGKNKIAEAKTDSSGIATFKNLKEGTYYYKEISTPDGYITIKQKEMQPIKIGYDKSKGEETIHTETIVNNPIKGKVKVVKVSEDNVTIEGAEFDIKDSNGTVVDHIVTDKNGEATSKELRKGNYTIVETKVPKDYVLLSADDAVSFAIVTDGKTVTKKIVNYYNKGYIEIKKVDSETKEFISGAVFDIYKVDANGKATKVDTISKYNAKGVGKSKELKNGKYYFIETVAPKNAILDKTKHEFEITEDKKQFSFTIENTIKKGQIKLVKKDNLGNSIKDVKFELLDSNKNVLETLTTNEKGEALSKRYEIGTYYLRETYTPDEYDIITDLVPVEIKVENQIVEVQKDIVNKRKPKGQIKLVKKDDLGNVIKDVKFELLDSKKNVLETLTTDEKGEALSKKYSLGTYYLRETYTPELYNPITNLVEVKIKQDNEIVELQKEIINKRKLKGQIKLVKKDDLGNAIKDVKFELLDSKKNVLETLTTDANGEAISKKYELGTYYLRETYTPELYVKITNLITVKIKEENEVKVIEKEIVNNRIIGGIKIIKKDDAGTLIPGVEFSVYKEGSTFATKKITTDEQGIAITTDLELGKYYFVETKVPDNLNINTEKVSFEITKQGDLITKEVVNERVKGKLIINKTNKENGTGIEGVVFEIYDENQTKLGSIVTDLEGIATTENLKDKDGKIINLYTGKYYWAEVSAPDRFYFEATMHEFNIVKGQENVVLNIENTPFKIPQTGGIIGTDALIVVIVSIVSITGYVVGNILINRRRFE